jgi:hypothetical protein
MNMMTKSAWEIPGPIEGKANVLNGNLQEHDLIPISNQRCNHQKLWAICDIKAGQNYENWRKALKKKFELLVNERDITTKKVCQIT